MSTKFKQPIFLVGTQRSGSNLLRVMLNQLDEIAAPHPPHILHTFFPFLNKYGDLNREEVFKELVNDVCSLVNYNPVSWNKFKLEPSKVYQRAGKERNLVGILNAIYSLYVESVGKRQWACKSLSNIHYTRQIEEAGLNPKYIHICRDGRDVALSFQKAVVGPKHIYFIAQKWHQEQQLAMALEQRIGNENFLRVHYEDLITDPEISLRKVCSFLDTEYNPKILKYYESNESLNTAQSGQMWQNLIKPIDKKNQQKFLHHFSPKELSIFEGVAQHSLTKLGYQLTTNPTDLSISQDELEKFKAIEENKNILVLKDSKNQQDLLKRAERVQFLNSLKQKLNRRL